MIRRNAIANMAGTLWTTLMGVLFLPLYVRYLGIEAFGLVGIFTVIGVWLMLLDAGITPATTREASRLLAARDIGELWRVLRTSEALGLAAGGISLIVLIAIAALLANQWVDTEALEPAVVTQAFVLMGFIIAIRFPENIYRAALIGLEHQVGLNVINGISALVRSGGAVLVLAYVSNSILAFFLWQALISLLGTVAMAIAVYRAVPGRARDAQFSRTTLERIWRFSLGAFLITALGTFISQIDKLVLSAMIPLAEFGYYAFAATVAGYVRILIQPVTQAVYPRLVALASERDEPALTHLYHRNCQLSAVLIGSAAVWLITFAPAVLDLWTQDRVFADRVAPIMALLLVGFALNGLLNGPYYLQMAHGWTSLLLRMNIAMAVLVGPAIWLAVRAYGAIGGAAAWTGVNLLYLAIMITLMHRKVLRGEAWRWWIEDTLLPVGAAALAAALAYRIIPIPDDVAGRAAGLLVAGLLCLAAAGLAAPQTRAMGLSTLRTLRHA